MDDSLAITIPSTTKGTGAVVKREDSCGFNLFRSSRLKKEKTNAKRSSFSGVK